MKNIILFFLIIMVSCTTLRKSEKYFYNHPEKANNVAKNYINKYKINGAKICLEEFPQKSTIDTFILQKDSIIINNITDSIYNILIDTHYITKDRIKKILIPCKDSTKIIKYTLFDQRYELLYDSLNKSYNDLSNRHDKVKNILFYTYFWIIIIIFGILAYIRFKA